MLLEANFPLNFTKLRILLLVNLVVVSRMISSNTQVAGLNVPLYLLNPFTQHLGKTWVQTVNTHRCTGFCSLSVPSEIILKAVFVRCQHQETSCLADKTLHSISEAQLNYTGSRSSFQHLKVFTEIPEIIQIWIESVCPVVILGQGL